MGEAWWWAAASGAQVALGIASYKRGCGEYSMPFKAFAIATLFVGAAATAAAGTLQAAGINTVDDMKDVGIGVRRWIKSQPGETN